MSWLNNIFGSSNEPDSNLWNYEEQHRKAQSVFIQGHNEEIEVILRNGGRVKGVEDVVDRIHERTCEQLDAINTQTPGAADEFLDEEDRNFLGWFGLKKRD